MSTKRTFLLAAASVLAASTAWASPSERAAEIRALASANILDEGMAGGVGYGRPVYRPEYEILEPIYQSN